MPQFDQTLPLAIKGYTWLPDLRRRAQGRPVPMRLMGRPAVGIGGPDAARFFYADDHLERHDALPPTVIHTLFGKGAVHTLDGAAHRHRKALFVTLLMGDGIDTLAKLAGEAFDERAEQWRGGPAVSLFDESAKAIAQAVTQWVGVPDEQGDLDALAADLVAMVDGFATMGPRHWRALAARRRRERWLAEIIERVRGEDPSAAPLSAIAHYTEDGHHLDPRTAAVELLKIIPPTTAGPRVLGLAGEAPGPWPA